MKSAIKWLLGLYVGVALVTFVLQAPDRFPACGGAAACGRALSKELFGRQSGRSTGQFEHNML